MSINRLVKNHTRLHKKLMSMIKKNPQSISSIARQIGISRITLTKFIKQDGMLTLINLLKIQRFIDKF